MKQLSILSLVVLSLAFCACSGNDYLNVIPAESTALISVDVAGATGQSKGVNANLLKSLFRVSDVADCGIDLSSKIYLFETVDGRLGIVSKVKNDKTLDKWLNRLADKGICLSTQKRRDLHFTVLRQSWLVGFSDEALLIMGPTVATEQSELMRTMMKFLTADEGIVGSPLFDKLETITSPVAMVAQAQALPQQLIAPFTIGAPADADASQVMIAAEIHADKGCMVMDGETFSFDEAIDSSLKNARKMYRPLSDEYLRMVPRQSLFTMAMNADGKQLLPLMRQSREFRALLTGVGVKIDIDKFIEQVDGDLVLTIPVYDDENMQMSWAAKLKANREMLDEESEQQLEKTRMQQPEQPLPDAVIAQISGSPMAVLLNLSAIGGDKQEMVSTFSALLKPLFGDVEYVVYRSKVVNGDKGR